MSILQDYQSGRKDMRCVIQQVDVLEQSDPDRGPVPRERRPHPAVRDVPAPRVPIRGDVADQPDEPARGPGEAGRVLPSHTPSVRDGRASRVRPRESPSSRASNASSRRRSRALTSSPRLRGGGSRRGDRHASPERAPLLRALSPRDPQRRHLPAVPAAAGPVHEGGFACSLRRRTCFRCRSCSPR